MSRKSTLPGWTQCNADIPASVSEALRVHLELTRVPKQDFVLLAIRNEVVRQRALGLGLVDGQVPPGGRGIA